jgi:hypothetical protein
LIRAFGRSAVDRADTAASKIDYTTNKAADPMEAIIPEFAGIAAKELSDADKLN